MVYVLVVMMNVVFAIPGYMLLSGDASSEDMLRGYIIGASLLWVVALVGISLLKKYRDTVSTVATVVNIAVLLVFIADLIQVGIDNKFVFSWTAFIVLSNLFAVRHKQFQVDRIHHVG